MTEIEKYIWYALLPFIVVGGWAIKYYTYNKHKRNRR